MSVALLEAHRLTAVTPDGVSLFEDLDLVLERRVMALVGRNGSGKSTLGRILAGRQLPDGGQLVRHGRVGWLPQEVQAEPEARVSDLLGVTCPLQALRRLQAGAGAPTDLDAIGDAWDLEAKVAAWFARFGLEHLCLEGRARECSGGELTRLGLIRLLLNDPDLLILDEPSNHLDSAGRVQLARFLEEWPGGALVITHDRALLERATRILELSAGALSSYPGPWAAYREAKEQERAAAEHHFDVARAEHRAQKQRRQAALERQQRRQNQARRDRREANQAKVLLDFMEQGSEATAARLRRQHAARVAESGSREQEARQTLEALTPIAMTIPSAGTRPGKRVLAVAGLSMGFGERTLYEGVNFELFSGERLVIIGANGSGKSVLLKLVCGELQARSGAVEVCSSMKVLDQHQTLLDERASALENFRRLAPGLSEADYRTRLARLGMRGDNVLRPVAVLSGGERLKVALAGILLAPQPPELLLLDEPTNHQDLESVAALEEALRDYDGALVIVSHDEHFLANVGVTHELRLARPQPVKTEYLRPE